MLNINEREVNDQTILDLEGNVVLGGGSAELRNTIRRLSEQGRNRIAINFESVKYIDSSGVGELINAAEMLNKAGGGLKLMNMPRKVEQVLSLSNVISMFEVDE